MNFGRIEGSVVDPNGDIPAVNAYIVLYEGHHQVVPTNAPVLDWAFTGSRGRFSFEKLKPGSYTVFLDAFGKIFYEQVTIDEKDCKTESVCFKIPFDFKPKMQVSSECGDAKDCRQAIAGRPMTFTFDANRSFQIADTTLLVPRAFVTQLGGSQAEVIFPGPGRYTAMWQVHSAPPTVLPLPPGTSKIDGPTMSFIDDVTSGSAVPQEIAGDVGVTMRRTASSPTSDQVLGPVIRNRTRAISFNAYREFINRVFCLDGPPAVTDPKLQRQLNELGSGLHGVGAYELLKTATEIFLLINCGVRVDSELTVNGTPVFDPDDEQSRLGQFPIGELSQRLNSYLGTGRLPYITRVIQAAFPAELADPRRSFICEGLLSARADSACLLELIWSYWHEEGMLVQSINALTRRFQNVRAPGDRDPLAHFELDPLRPLNNILWGYIQDEQHRLSLMRRAYEYDHHYGLTLIGRAARPLRPADSRSKFLEAFHNLLHRTAQFFREDNDTTVISDGFPLLNALKEVHLILAQGAHNQFGDLPWTARVEMLIQMWILARPEIRDFLQSRAMVPYTEAWMPQVDTMKTMQSWTDTTVSSFHDLAVFGEQLLLSIRYGDWIDVHNEDSAKNWARSWRPEIQSYIHSYRGVTGVDLTNPDTVDVSMPAVHLKRRLDTQQQRVR